MTNATVKLSILRSVDAAAVDELARVETRRREAVLPPIGAFRWWARRTRAVTEAVLRAAENDLGDHLAVADPFAGGGTIPLVASLAGHQTYAQDINPWATHNIATMLTLPPVQALEEGAAQLESQIRPVLDAAYGSGTKSEATVSQTIRVLSGRCTRCESDIKAFPHALVSLTNRTDAPVGGLIDEAYLACPAGHVFLGRRSGRQRCPVCKRATVPGDSYTTGRIIRCYECGKEHPLGPFFSAESASWEVALIQRISSGRREISPPTTTELELADSSIWSTTDLGRIEEGIETRVLTRHGFINWSDAYPRRQQHVLQHILDEIGRMSVSKDVKASLLHAAVGTAEMAGYLSRWDRRYLKSYEAMARHRFSVTTLPVEPNVWGAGAYGRGTMRSRLKLMAKGSGWLDQMLRGRSLKVLGPLPSHARRRRLGNTDIIVVNGSSDRVLLQDAEVDLVLTDPPYHDDVHYGDLSQPLRAWAGFGTTRLPGEAVASGTTSDEEYENLLLAVFRESHRILKPGGHLVFSYSNRDPRAWVALFNSLQSAGFHGIGFSVVLSENESDPAKQGRHHCHLDMLIDAIPSPRPRMRRFRPTLDHRDWSAEVRFLQRVGEVALDVGLLGADWSETFVAELAETEFVSGKSNRN